MLQRKWFVKFHHIQREDWRRLWVCWGIGAVLAVACGVILCRLFPSLSPAARYGACILYGLWLASLALCVRLSLSCMEARGVRRLDLLNREEMKAFQVKQRTQRHDFNLHLMALAGMLDGGRYQECSDYLRQILSVSREVTQVMPLDDPAVSAMLNQIMSDAKHRGVSIECSVYDDLRGICCDAYEVNQILGNLIRNAVEAAAALPPEKRNVFVTLLRRRNQCIFRVENALEAGTVLDNQIFEYGYSRKSGHSGTGLAAVKRLVTSYKGTVFAEQESEKLCMVVQLPCQKGEL